MSELERAYDCGFIGDPAWREVVGRRGTTDAVLRRSEVECEIERLLQSDNTALDPALHRGPLNDEEVKKAIGDYWSSSDEKELDRVVTGWVWARTL